MNAASLHRLPRLCALLAFVAIALCMLPCERFALGSEPEETPCILTDEQRAAYEADGTLADRIDYQKSLHNDRPAEGLVSQAIEREQAARGGMTYSVPTNWASGMAAVGSAHVLGLRISFPDYAFEQNDTLEAFQAIIGPTAQCGVASSSASPFPYESLSAYYYRASYGKLSLTGEAFDYQAKHERDYYTNNPETLAAEALAALDESEDLSRFDANDDGKIDAVYIHFAGPHTGWGSTWWSNESIAADSTLYENDSVRLWNMVLLAGDSTDPWSARTIIHETGHVLGLPDYYSAKSQTGSGPQRSGILTFDMMMQNMGDHNGYSKWLVGWLPEDKITRIVANEEGITVTRNNVVEKHHDAIDGNTPAIEATIGAYATDDASETGGIIVVSNQDKGMFSSQYVIEYDRFAGNQSVQFLDANGTLRNLPSGFRVFRVRGELTDDGSEYANSNLYGTVHNQLIELVDPDMDKEHTINDATHIPCAAGAHEYGCMLFAGSTITPQGYPSTNFFENANIGFSGLTLEAKQTGGDTATISVSYSDDLKPDISNELTLTPTFETFTNASVLTFHASTPIVKETEQMLQAKLRVDDSTYELPITSVEGTDVSTKCLLDPETISPSSSCEIVYPAGMFVIGKTAEETVLSPEVRIPIKADPSMANIAAAGFYQGTGYIETTPVTSDVLSCADGSLRFLQATDGILSIHTIDSRNPERLSSSAALQLPLGNIEEISKTVALENNRIFAVVSASGYPPETVGLWIDLDTNDIVAHIDLSGMSILAAKAHESSVIMASNYYGESLPGGTTLSLLQVHEDGSISAKHAWTSRTDPLAANEHILFSRLSHEGKVSKTDDVLLFSLEGIAQRIAEVGSSNSAIPAAEDICSEVQAETICSIDLCRTLMSATETPDGYAMVFSHDFSEDEAYPQSELLISFDRMGNKCAEAALPASELMYSGISAGSNGTITLSSPMQVGDSGGAQELRKTIFYDPATLEVKKTLTAATETTGAWLSDGSWINVGRSITNTMNGAGSPLGDMENYAEGPLLHYSITEPIDTPKTAPETPPEPPTPPSIGDSDSPAYGHTDAHGSSSPANTALEKSFAQTVDSAAVLAAMIASVAATAACVAVIARTAVRKRIER